MEMCISTFALTPDSLLLLVCLLLVYRTRKLGMFQVYMKRKSEDTISVLVQAACIWSENTRLTNSEVYIGN